MSYRETAFATVRDGEERNEAGRMQDCIYAKCTLSDDEVGPIWVGGNRGVSIRRAMAELTESCSCGRTWHEEEE